MRCIGILTHAQERLGIPGVPGACGCESGGGTCWARGSRERTEARVGGRGPSNGEARRVERTVLVRHAIIPRNSCEFLGLTKT